MAENGENAGQAEQRVEAVEVPQRDSDAIAAGAPAKLLENLAEKLGGRASVTAVFGEPVTRDGVTVVPVARVGLGIGAGAGHRVGAEGGGGGGGGGGVDARPVGFIEIKDGTAVYTAIRDPWRDIALPLAVVLAGSLGMWAVRALGRRWGRRG